MVEASLYFHIPFCARKCPYCHFYVTKSEPDAIRRYVEALLLEWQSRKQVLEGYTIVSIYFGGGTPSQIGREPIERILDEIAKSCTFSERCEVTLEANPEDVNEELMQIRGVNRISMGVQSFDESLLKLLGRRHTAKEAIKAIELAAKAIGNVTIDLMYELPKQTITSWKESLEWAKKLPIDHLSLYNLTFESGTVFERKKKNLLPLVPSDETCLRLFEMPDEILEIKRYETSAFAKPGFQSQHNRGYWQGRPFLGFGPSACSYWENRRLRNVPNLRLWEKACHSKSSPIDDIDALEKDAARNELLIIGLRLLEGIDRPAFEQKYGALSTETQAQIMSLQKNGLLEVSTEKWRLSQKGLRLHDTIAEMLVVS